MIILDAESFKKAKFTLALILINIFFFIIFNIILPIQYILLLVQINSNILEGEIWRLFTSMFLHADAIHLFSNMVALLIFGTAVENNFRRIEFIIIYLLSGLIGNLFSLVLLPINTISLGASGAIFGLIGAAFIFFAKEDQTFLILGLVYVLYFVFTSFAPGINYWAHIFGLIGGILLGYLFKKKIFRSQKYDAY